MQVLSEYLEFLEIEKGLANNTTEAYRRDLTDFLEYCAEKGVNSLDLIQRNNINNYIRMLRMKKTIRRQVLTVK